jgi:hypothetical protein
MSKDVARLLALVDEQKERIRQLEEQMGFHLQAPLVLGLTRTQAAIFGCLYSRPFGARETILQAHEFATGNAAEPKTIDVHITKLRQKIAPHGIFLETIHGQGYRMPDESKMRVAEMFVAEVAQQAAVAAQLMRHSHAKPAAHARAV